MRIVLIVQSLIILAGAYYVYILTQDSPRSENEVENSVSEIKMEVQSEDNLPEINENKQDPEDVNEITITDGPNDLGMEFPIPDNDESLESR